MQLNEIRQHNFLWCGLNNRGEKISGQIQAATSNLAILSLKQDGIHVIKINRTKSFFLRRGLHRFSNQDLSIFFQHLASLYQSGISLAQAFDILYHNHKNITFQKVLFEIKRNIEAGKSLSASMAERPTYFSELTLQLIHIGEQTGQLSLILSQLIASLERKNIFKKKIKQTLFYPMVILTMALFVSLVMITFVVPYFAELFKTMELPLPPLTQAVVAVSHLFRSIYFIFGSTIITLTLAACLKLKKTRRLFLSFWPHIPYLGPFLNKIILLNFIQNLRITLNAGIPIIEALKLIAKNLSYFENTKTLMLFLQREIEMGKELYQVLEKNPFFPELLVQMVKIGERSGKLNHMLEQTAKIYDDEITHLLSYFTQLLEPLIMIILGVLIGGVVIAMYLPIFKLGAIV